MTSNSSIPPGDDAGARGRTGAGSDGEAESRADMADAFLLGLLNEHEAARVRGLAGTDAKWARSLAEAQARLGVLRSLPNAEPSEELIGRTLTQALERDDEREHTHRHRRRLMNRSMFGVLLALFAVLGMAQLSLWRMTPPQLGVDLFTQSEFVAASRASARVIVSDLDTGQPVEGKEVRIHLRSGTGKSVQLARFTTDENGTGSPSFEVPDWENGAYTLEVATGSGAFDVLSQSLMLKRDHRVMLSTDKSAYQPGQVVHMRTLSLGTANRKPLQGAEALFTVMDPRGNLVFKREQKTSAFGIAATDFQLADEVIEGNYTLACVVAGVRSERTVEVKRYVLPKYKVELTTEKSFYAPGEVVKGSVKAAYFFGKPVGGVVNVRVRPLGVAGEEIPLPKFSLEAGGEGTFSVRLPTKMFGRPQDGGDARIEVVAEVTDTAGQSVTKVVSRPVSASPLRVDIVEESGRGVAGLPSRLYISVTDPAGAPVEATVVVDEVTVKASKMGVAVVEYTPSGVLNQTVVVSWRGSKVEKVIPAAQAQGAFILRPAAGVVSAGEALGITVLAKGPEPVFLDLLRSGQTVLTTVIAVDNGKGEAVIDLPADLTGVVQLEAFRLNREGLPERVSQAIVVQPSLDLNVTMRPMQASLRPGEQAQFELTVTDHLGQPAPGAISLAVVDEAALNVGGDRPGMEATFFRLEEEILKPALVAYDWDPFDARWLKNAELEPLARMMSARTSRRAAVPAEGRAARRWDFNVSQAARPAYFEMKQVTGSTRQVAKQRFTAAKRELEEKILMGGAALAGVLLTFGLVRLTVWLGKPAITIGVGLVLLLTCIGVLLPAAGKARSSALSMKRSMGVESEPGSMPPAAYGVAPATNASPGGASMLSPLRVREWFPETLVWLPELVTDDAGRSLVSFEMADSITNWKALGSAVTSDGRLGTLESDVVVFQPFFVDVNAPVALTRGDTVELPIVVYNYLDSEQTVSIAVDEPSWCQLLADPTITMTLKANEVRSVPLRLKALKVGSHQLLVTARAGEIGDAIRSSIEVVPEGVRQEAIVTGAIDSPLEASWAIPSSAIAGSEKLIVRVLPSTLSQVVSGLDGLLRMPHGCFEQTSSATYPNVLVLDYMKRMQTASPELEAKAREYVNLGYQRLLTFEVPGGGFEWFGRPPANVLLTAYGLMQFTDMSKVHEVDPALLTRTRAWLIGKRSADGSWPSDDRPMHNAPLQSWGEHEAAIARTAYVAWSIFSDDYKQDAEPTLDFLRKVDPSSLKNPHALALLCNATLALDAESAGPALKSLASMASVSDSGEQAHWEPPANGRTTFYGRGNAAAIETTALAVVALHAGGEHRDLVRKALAWLVANQDASGAWYSTQGTVLTLKALVEGAEIASAGTGERVVRILVDGTLIKEVRIPSDQSDVVQQVHLSDLGVQGAATIVVDGQGGAGTAQIVQTWHEATPDVSTGLVGLSVDVKYDKPRLKTGSTLLATATVTNKSDGFVPMVMVDLPLPPGFKPDMGEFEAMVTSQQIAKYQMTARAIIVYLRGVEGGKSIQIRYGMEATMPVEVTIPAARVWEYYKPENRNVGGEGKVIVR